MPGANQDNDLYSQFFAKQLQEAGDSIDSPLDQIQELMDQRMPKVGDIVLYRVGPGDPPDLRYNYAEILPAVVVQVWGESCVNLKIFTDGPVDAWKTSVLKGDESYHWNYRPE